MYVCWVVHQDTYLDIWVGRVIIIICQDNNLLCCSTTWLYHLPRYNCFHQILLRIFGFMIVILYQFISCLLLVFYPTCLLLLSDHTMSLPCLISYVVYLLASVCLCLRHCFQCILWSRFIDIRVLIHTRHLAFASPLAGEFWLLWILMSRFWSLERVDSPSWWSECAAVAWIFSRPSRALSFQAPLFGSRVFLLWLWACLYTVHTCTSLCILAIAHISDVIFM